MQSKRGALSVTFMVAVYACAGMIIKSWLREWSYGGNKQLDAGSDTRNIGDRKGSETHALKI